MIGSAAGFCQKHKIEKMFVGTDDATEPTCVRCVADATPKLGRTQSVEDPGEGFFIKGTPSNAKVTILKDVSTSATNNTISIAPAGSIIGLESCVEQSLCILRRVPMPRDIKQFKSLQKAIKILENLVEKT